MFRHLSKPDSPFNRFGTGNLDTLKGENIRNDILDFYNKYYSSNLMRLIILSDQPINKMEEHVRELFKSVKN